MHNCWYNFQSLKVRRQQNTTTEVNSQQFLNRVIGCVNLYEIDPTNLEIQTELAQLRQQIAQYFATLDLVELESIHQTSVGQAYQTILKSGFQQNPLNSSDQQFLKTLGIQSLDPITSLTSINAQLVALLYSDAQQIKSFQCNQLPIQLQHHIRQLLNR